MLFAKVLQIIFLEIFYVYVIFNFKLCFEQLFNNNTNIEYGKKMCVFLKQLLCVWLDTITEGREGREILQILSEQRCQSS